MKNSEKADEENQTLFQTIGGLADDAVTLIDQILRTVTTELVRHPVQHEVPSTVRNVSCHSTRERHWQYVLAHTAQSFQRVILCVAP